MRHDYMGYDKMKISAVFTEKRLLRLLFLALTGVIIFYNTDMYFAHREGKISEVWYLISVILPLIVMIVGYLKIKELERQEVSTR